MTERLITIAGEQIELPVATDHNKQIDYLPLGQQMNLLQWFTPVVGNEVTTKRGHFNVFPLSANKTPPNHNAPNWKELFQSIRQKSSTPIIILNHARDVHSGYRPFGPESHLSLVGENLDGWKLEANAMEVINSAAQQTNPLELLQDWMNLQNAGSFLIPIGCSDSHDVARHFVGQARTYIRCDDSNPGKIDRAEAIENLLKGQVTVSCGLFVEMTIDNKYGPGELVVSEKDKGKPLHPVHTIQVRVSGPGWSEAERMQLYKNGKLWKSVDIPVDKRNAPGLKLIQEWELSRPVQDTQIVALALGSGSPVFIGR